MDIKEKITSSAVSHPKTITWVMVILTLALSLMMVRLKVDTDPENMLDEHEAVRVFHHQVKEMFTLHDMVVLGVVNETDPNGVFTPKSLGRIYDLSRFAATLKDPKDPSRRVVKKDLMAPDTVDAIIQDGPGQVRFEWLMGGPPKTQAEADQIRKKAMDNPLFKGTMVSEDGKALAVYIPISAKDFAYGVRKALLDKISELTRNDPGSSDKFYITGLPVAEDTFGVEMFIQMAVSAPLAMVMIFLLMWFFFKNIRLIIAPMIVAMVSVLSTMGLLIGTGNTVHIMSSMIPIFLMPIAVVDSIHILSEFFDRYGQTLNREKTIREVMNQLFMPMLYTSLTSAAGFASLALTPIPPVQVFGIFVAIGIMTAWVWTILFVPAYVLLLKEETLANIGAVHAAASPDDKIKGGHGRFSAALASLGRFTYARAKLILVVSALIMGVSAYGISKIQVNDNPVKWFHKSHDIRVADRVLNRHFGGTYEAYLVLADNEAPLTADRASALVREAVKGMTAADGEDGNRIEKARAQALALIDQVGKTAATADTFFDNLGGLWDKALDTADDNLYDFWARGQDAMDRIRHRDQIFKRPDMLNYLAQLQKHLQASGIVGKTNSVADVVKKVHQELFESDPGHYTIPATGNAVAQCLISYQNSHKPDNLWHLVTPDYKTANIWVQLKNGDNKDMERTVAAAKQFFKDHPAPVSVTHNWAGLTYLNVVWQDKMVFGMLYSFLGSFIIVFGMMVVLFRSVLWGALAMVPLSVTITAIYGFIGFIGKDYDMPVAVLSALTLGLAVDFAIHFLERSRMAVRQAGSWKEGITEMFEEPARAISRNIIVIAIGFTPLLLAPLVPYQTVGVFLASIMAVSGFGTILILPALVTVLDRWLFKKILNGAARTTAPRTGETH